MAEEVGYSVVWEEEKNASNVIDYNIRKEQTKDTFAVENMNNQTTTGMATQIPWINEPKLIWKTSVIWSSWWWWGWWGWISIVDINNYQSVAERQPVVDRVMWWEFVCVRTIFTEYWTSTKFFFIPSYDRFLNYPHLLFACNTPWNWILYLRVICWLSWTTVTSITTDYGNVT